MPAKRENVVLLVTSSVAVVDVSTKRHRAATLIDVSDLPLIVGSPRRWYVKFISGQPYVVRNIGPKRKERTELLHRVILGLTERFTLGDHRSHDTMDNRRSQLRTATPQQNGQNSRSRGGAVSGFLGVSFSRAADAWLAQIRVHGKNLNLGYHETEDAAARAYDAAAREYFGQFANPNFKEVAA